jgi:transposase InsO family protein
MSEEILYSFDKITAQIARGDRMPFKGETVEMNRASFVKEVEAKANTMAALCRKYGISRPTGYLWLKRYRDGETMSNRSRRPFHTANKTAEKMESKIVEIRKAEPGGGAVKIGRRLKDEGNKDVPCGSTINAILHRNKLITKEASEAATPHKRFEKEFPNDMWQCDFKGHYGLGDGSRCHPLSVLDDHSRFCLCADAKENEQFPGVKESFERMFMTYGLPNILLCDNGTPWGSSQSGGITKFDAWMMELGILPIHIRVRHPQTQGKIEKFNGSFKQERLKFYIPEDMRDAHRQRLEYREFYNNVRPHHALKLDTPAEHYTPSDRAYPDIIAPWEYEDGVELRNIKSSGYITYNGQGYFLSEGLGGLTVAVKPSSVDGFLNVFFRQFKVSRINLNENSVVSRKIYLRENDPRSTANPPSQDAQNV